ncbi:MAG: DUF1552 domain-containing protein, partial [Acidobacteria bacterium]|nr:DUF1552 domain-containing protein [Acidobacteriota bacterium]
DLTRVCTFLYGREKSVRTYPEVGVGEPHHPVSHHRHRPEQLEKLARINTFHMEIFGRFLEKLRDTPDGDGSLLDQAMVMYGAGMGNSNAHDPLDLPIVLAGGGAGTIKGGRHVRAAEGTPLANLHLAVLEKMGIRAESLGNSTGQLPILSDV